MLQAMLLRLFINVVMPVFEEKIREMVDEDDNTLDDNFANKLEANRMRIKNKIKRVKNNG